jgi:dinuclear metal center YbgI/SA1388 family protein
MLCEDTQKAVHKVAVCLEINEKIINLAIDGGYDLIITHHPFIFRALKGIIGSEYRMISSLIKNSISVLSYHTRFDAAQGGINDALAKALDLSDIKAFGGGEAPMGRYGTLEKEMTPEEFGEYIKEKLSCPSVRCAISDKNKMIKTVSVLGGGGKDFLYEAAKISDAFVTGDLSHNAFIDALERDFCAYEAGHYHTENVGAREMKKLLKKEFSDVEIEFLDSESPFSII